MGRERQPLRFASANHLPFQGRRKEEARFSGYLQEGQGVVVGDVNALPLPHRPRQSFQSVLRERMAQVSFPFQLYGLATAWNFAGRSFLSSTL